MPEIALIILATGAIVVPLAKTVPSIVWSFRCPADSPNYKRPPVFRPDPPMGTRRDN